MNNPIALTPEAMLIAGFISALDREKQVFRLDSASVAIQEFRRRILADFAARRPSFHGTFNGGHHDEPAHSAFHHGMDTVFNALEAEARDESRQAPPLSSVRSSQEETKE